MKENYLEKKPSLKEGISFEEKNGESRRTARKIRSHFFDVAIRAVLEHKNAFAVGHHDAPGKRLRFLGCRLFFDGRFRNGYREQIPETGIEEEYRQGSDYDKRKKVREQLLHTAYSMAFTQSWIVFLLLK